MSNKLTITVPKYSNKAFNADNSDFKRICIRTLTENNNTLRIKAPKSSLHTFPSQFDEIVHWDNSLKKTSFNNTLYYRNSPIYNTKNWLKNCFKLYHILNLTHSFNWDNDNIQTIITANKMLTQSEKFTNNNTLAFRCKIFNKSLPTRTFLNNRYPTLYNSNLCPICQNEPKDLLHLICCQSQSTETTTLKLKIHKLINSDSTTHSFNISSLDILFTLNGKIPKRFSIDNIQIKAKIMNLVTEYTKQIWISRSNIANNALNGIKWILGTQATKTIHTSKPITNLNQIFTNSYKNNFNTSIAIALQLLELSHS
jgi:hypothetical protein